MTNAAKLSVTVAGANGDAQLEVPPSLKGQPFKVQALKALGMDPSSAGDFCLVLDGVKLDGVGTTLEIVNCLIRDNSKDGIECKEGTAGVWNCTIDNSGDNGIKSHGDDGEGETTGVVTVINSIISNSGEHGLNSSKGTIVHSYNLLYSNTAGNYDGTTAGTGELSADPLFVGSGDYQLLGQSPAIDVGTSITLYPSIHARQPRSTSSKDTKNFSSNPPSSSKIVLRINIDAPLALDISLISSVFVFELYTTPSLSIKSPLESILPSGFSKRL